MKINQIKGLDKIEIKLDKIIELLSELKKINKPKESDLLLETSNINYKKE